MKLRKLRKLFFTVVATIIIFLATLSTLMETENGSRWVIAGVAKTLGITHGPIAGNLRSGLDLEFIDYRNGEQHFRAEAVSFRWRPAALLYKTLAIKTFSANNILIQLPPAPAKKTVEPFSRWPQLQLPVQIQLEQIQIANIQYVQGATRLAWRQLSGALTWGGTELHYQDLALLHENYQLHLTGNTGLDFPYSTDAFLQWQWAAPAREAAPAPLLYRGVTALEGSLQELQLRNEINSPVQLTADAKLHLVDKKNQLQTVPLMTLALAWQQQTLPAQWWVPGQAVPRTSGKLTATGTWKKYQAQLAGDLYVPERPGLAITAVAAGDLESIQIERLHLRTLRELPATAPTSITNNRDAFRLANIVATTIANTLEKNIQLDPFQVDTPVVDDPASGLHLDGNVRWLPHVQWQINADAQHLDLGSLLQDWPSKLNATFSTQGEFNHKIWTAELRDLQVTGSVRDINVSGNGSVKFDGANVSSDALHIIFGANQLRVNGSMGEQFNLDWDLHAPILQQIDQQISGSVQSKGQLRGNRAQPQLNATATAEQFSWKNYGVEKLDLSLAPQNTPSANTLSTTGGDALLSEQYKVAFLAKQLHIAANRFSTIQIDGSGSINNHQLQGSVRSSAYGRADLKIKGKYDGREWQGKLGQLAIKLKNVPRWWLTSSETMRVSADAIQVGDQCLTTRSNLTAVVERSESVEREELSGDWLPNQSPAKSPNAWLVNRPALPANGVEKYSLPQLCLRADWAPANGLHANARI
ncbi:MAG TPA: hypothetical protein VLC79_13970, partial [Cellvibrio sp.]|nr:hypothetical protein [Cellvibrio sp.]